MEYDTDQKRITFPWAPPVAPIRIENQIAPQSHLKIPSNEKVLKVLLELIFGR